MLLEMSHLKTHTHGSVNVWRARPLAGAIRVVRKQLTGEGDGGDNRHRYKRWVSHAFPPNIIYLQDAPSAVFHLPRPLCLPGGYHNIVQHNFDSLKT